MTIRTMQNSKHALHALCFKRTPLKGPISLDIKIHEHLRTSHINSLNKRAMAGRAMKNSDKDKGGANIPEIYS